MSRGLFHSLLGVLVIVGLGALLFWYDQQAANLKDTSVTTGYVLLGAMLALGLFRLRKRLSMIPLGRAAHWLGFHVVVGIVAVLLFWLHTGTFWPTGVYEQVLAALVYLLTLSGLFGYWIQKVLPARITDSGIEIIWERIPAEIAAIREDAEQTVATSTRETGSDVLAREYQSDWLWYFARPRFAFAALTNSDRPESWIRGEAAAVRRYLDDAERKHLDHLLNLADYKRRVDLHYWSQGLMKRWLLFHVPLSAAFLILALWHTLVILVYGT